MAQPTLHDPLSEAPRSIDAHAPLARAMNEAAEAVAAALGEFAGVEVQVNQTHVEMLPLSDLFHVGGGPGDDVVALFLTFSGSDTGDIMLLYELEQARALVDQLLWNPPGTTVDFDEIALSALAESGNILGSHFLTAIATLTETELDISTPEPLVDFRGAVLSVSATTLASSGDTFLAIRSDFRYADGTGIGAMLLVVPHRGFDSAILRSLA